MWNRIGLLTRIEICNLFGLNQRKYGARDKSAKKERSALIAYIIVYAIFGFYGLMYAFSLNEMGLASEIPSFFVLIVSIVILISNVFQAGNILFNLKSYERLAPLPFKPIEIVISRFLHLYLINIVSTIVFFVPPMFICAFSIPGISILYVLATIIELILVAFLPTTIAILLGTIVMLFSSKMKHKTLFKTIFSLVLLVGVFVLSFMLNSSQPTPEEEAQAIEFIHNLAINIKVYFWPSKFFYNAVINNSYLDFLFLILINIIPFILICLFVSLNFVPLCQRLNMTRKEKAKRIESFSKKNVFQALFKKEAKRFFSSSLYVTNCSFGYLIMVIAAIAFAIAGKGALLERFPNESYIGKGIALIMLFSISMTCTTASSISMEGKQWWIMQSLPIDNKTKINSKLALNFAIAAPFYFISVIIFLIGLRSTNPFDYLLIVFVPISSIIFTAIYGLKMNIKYPLFNYSNEAEVVKQSKAVGFLMLLDTGLFILIAFPTFFIPSFYGYLYGIIVSVVLIIIAFGQYKKLLKFDFKQIN